jgi:holo-[acyl-carrier protein] synthase
MSYIGVDIVEIGRIARAVTRWGERFLQRVYTEEELIVCRNRISSLAARFAAKEAVMKALGTGTHGVGWREVEILRDPSGKPVVYLHGRARKRARKLKLKKLAISLSHSRDYAIASVVGGTI